jgi:hypothetical protein
MFPQLSYYLPVEVELLPRPDGTLCLFDPVNRADLRHAGIEMTGDLMLMDPDSYPHRPVPTWVPADWDIPFVYSTSGPTILKYRRVDTFYDFQR